MGESVMDSPKRPFASVGADDRDSLHPPTRHSESYL